MKKILSVVTVCYNSEKTIERTMDSVLEQTVYPDEYVIIDGASTDNTCKLIERYTVLFAEKGILFTYISEADKGIYDAMNKGSKLASGEWIHFLNSDDYYVNKFVLSALIPFLQNAEEDIIYGRVIREKQKYQSTFFEVSESKLKKNILFGCPIAQPATFYRRKLFDDYSFDTSYKISADYKLFVELIKANTRFCYIPYFITCFGESGISSTDESGISFRENIRLLEENGYTSFFIKTAKTALLHKFYCLFLELYSKGDSRYNA